MRRAALFVLVLTGACNNVLGIPEVSHHLDGGSKSDASIVCAEGKKDCAGVCVSASDPTTGCGGDSCDPCTYAHGGAKCTDGACAMDGCDKDFADCNNSADDGCEVDTSTDAKNCSRCQAACAGALQCAFSACVCVDNSDCTNGGTCDVPNCRCNGTACKEGVACTSAGSCGS